MSVNRFWANCNLSIHPRNWPDVVLDALKWRERRKLNTSAKKSAKTIARTVAGIERHLAVHPHDAASRAHLAALKSAA